MLSTSVLVIYMSHVCAVRLWTWTAPLFRLRMSPNFLWWPQLHHTALLHVFRLAARAVWRRHKLPKVLPVAPLLGRLCIYSSTSMQSWTLNHCFNGKVAVNFSGQTDRPWEITIHLSYNFLPLKPMLKSSSKEGYPVEIWDFPKKMRWWWIGVVEGEDEWVVENSRPFWEIWREKVEKSTFENFGDIYKKLQVMMVDQSCGGWG